MNLATNLYCYKSVRKLVQPQHQLNAKNFSAVWLAHHQQEVLEMIPSELQ